jgi:hypothetical protein
MTEPGNDDPVEGSPPAEDAPVDDIQVRHSGLVAGGAVRITGDNVAGRDHLNGSATTRDCSGSHRQEASR